MSNLTVTLFGKFNIVQGGQRLEGIRSRKAQELFSYLLLYRNHPQPRESLSELLWRDHPPDKSKKYLRQSLWILHSALDDRGYPHARELLIEGDWIQINPSANFWVDAGRFERIYDLVKDKPAKELSQDDFKSIRKAIHLYKGNLLEGWYQDWCVVERERFEIMYLMLLDKLIQFCEIQHDFDSGLAYGTEILRHDRAYERAHRQMMRLYYFSGDRTQALHQYERCVTALRNELDVGPSEETQRLYEHIRSDAFKPTLVALEMASPEAAKPANALFGALQRLIDFSDELSRIQLKVQKEIMALKNTLPLEE